MKKNKVFGILLSGSLLLGSFGEVHSMAASAVVSAIASATPSATATAVTASVVEAFGMGGALGYPCGFLSLFCFWRFCSGEEEGIPDQPQRLIVAPPAAGEIPLLETPLPINEAIAALSGDSGDSDDEALRSDDEALRLDEQLY
ncbi:MAG: hypothetical protein LBJ71_00985 [Holosporaceae bacterium]|jgi:ABC-type Fe3+-hydroxamate transport system substrate-binding protein|nr:hypothetical protein [Holosporaceae bacterium]